MSSKLRGSLCFTLEANYCRSHNSVASFDPEAWMELGRHALEALVDLDAMGEAPREGLPQSAEGSEDEERLDAEAQAAMLSEAYWSDGGSGPPAQGGGCFDFDFDSLEHVEAECEDGEEDRTFPPRARFVDDLWRANAWLQRAHAALKVGEQPPQGLRMKGPCRTQPWFAVVSQPPYRDQVIPELVPFLGETVELIERRRAPGPPINGRRSYMYLLNVFSEKVELPVWVHEQDLVFVDAMEGRFYYRVCVTTPVTADPEPDSPQVWELVAGALVEASERRVVEGQLRVLISGGLDDLWASEYASSLFDPRLGGEVQLLRLRELPTTSCIRDPAV
mmetsp:Transcript_67487/g.144359  ORF Transcript_67487/g.144359 Transcript_67487/m.144359 type:complete len:334 (+) Transcript_67487:93-1094(+)